MTSGSFEQDAGAADPRAVKVEDRLDIYGEHEAGLQQWMQRFGPLARQVSASQSLVEVCKAAMAVAQECMAAQTAAASAQASHRHPSFSLFCFLFVHGVSQ